MDLLSVPLALTGCFAPAWILIRPELSQSAKLLYLRLAQSVNSLGQAQLNPEIAAWEIGEKADDIYRHANELESFGLIETIRHPLKADLIRCSFPRHPWMEGRELAGGGKPKAPAKGGGDGPAPAAEPAAGPPPKSARSRREGRRGRRARQAGSRHSFESCMMFAEHRREVSGPVKVWSVEGLARHIFETGEDDHKIDALLAELKAA